MDEGLDKHLLPHERIPKPAQKPDDEPSSSASEILEELEKA